jgi:uncharacterized protein (DUF58 family)
VSFETESHVSRTAAATGTVTRTHITGAGVGIRVNAAFAWVRTRERFAEVGHASQRWAQATVTPAGWLVLAWATLGLSLGRAFGWVEFVGAGVFALVLLLLSVPFLLGKESYDVDLHLTDERVVAGREVKGMIVVANRGKRLALPGRIDIPVGAGLVDFHVPLLRSGHEHREEVFVPAHRRGVIVVGPATTVRGDPLRILKREFRWAGVSTLYVHPVTTSIPSTSAGLIRDLEGSQAKVVVNQDISFHAIREYARGDAQRQIHWKSTAKTGTLMVRQFDETRRSQLAVILSLTAADYALPDEFEMAVSAAGSLGVRAIRDGRELSVVVSAEIPEFARASVRSIRHLGTVSPRTLLDDLAAIETSGSVMRVEEVCAMVAEAVFMTSIVFVVGGSNVSLRRLQAAALAFPADVTTVAVVCNPEAEPSLRSFAGLHLMSIGVLADLRHLMARGAAA